MMRLINYSKVNNIADGGNVGALIGRLGKGSVNNCTIEHADIFGDSNTTARD